MTKFNEMERKECEQMMLAQTPMGLFTLQLEAAQKSWQKGQALLPGIEALEVEFLTALRDARQRATTYAALSTQQYRLATGHLRSGRSRKGHTKLARSRSFAGQARQAWRERRVWGRRLHELCQIRRAVKARKKHYFRLLAAARNLLPTVSDRELATII